MATTDLRTLVDPARAAVLTMELQEGVVGRDAFLPALVQEVERAGTIDTVRRICDAARAAGARVVHCTHVSRPDGAGGAVNARILAIGEKLRRERGRGATQIGTPGAGLVDGLLDAERDIVVERLHGMTPFTSTSLDQVLRNLGVRTVIATGASLNVGVFGMAVVAVDLGYQVVVPRDAVAGVPAEYASAVIENSLAMLATVTTSDELLAAWGANA